MTLISALRSYRVVGLDTVHQANKEHKEIRKMGLNSRELADNACPFCGAHKYHLVLRWDMQAQTNGLFARCAQCQRPR